MLSSRGGAVASGGECQVVSPWGSPQPHGGPEGWGPEGNSPSSVRCPGLVGVSTNPSKAGWCPHDNSYGYSPGLGVTVNFIITVNLGHNHWQVSHASLCGSNTCHGFFPLIAWIFPLSLLLTLSLLRTLSHGCSIYFQKTKSTVGSFCSPRPIPCSLMTTPNSRTARESH